jgi:hypothetical protein
MSRSIYGQKERKVTKGWRELHNGEIHTLYTSHIMRMSQPKLMQWERRLACTNEKL